MTVSGGGGAPETENSGGGARRGRSRGVRVLLWTLAVLMALVLVAGAAFLVWVLTPHRAEPGPLAEAGEDPAVVVERREGAVVLAPAEDPSGTGMVFYSGARVEADAYAAVWAPVVARTGVTVVLPDLRLNLALLDSARAESAVEAAPEISEWYLGGHSMGGAFAAQHLGTGDGDVEWAGLVLWGSYAIESADLADRDDLRVLSVAGGRDGVLIPDEVEERRPNLPEDAVIEVIEGMNHAQFGAYGDQAGDAEPELTDDQAHQALAEITATFLEAS
ncbi:alpha/beta hydrolase [Nocardiopsis metallicus]|uniref:Dienelactone hydrolase n=2 Tax=Nocardiopsis metallicus TaxID=179819 RepID=A0A840W516_9ACTN|nr:dienelactone hydrolase [Nocardiopsis metallicus]